MRYWVVMILYHNVRVIFRIYESTEFNSLAQHEMWLNSPYNFKVLFLFIYSYTIAFCGWFFEVFVMPASVQGREKMGIKSMLSV